jgi:hypothetical protein
MVAERYHTDHLEGRVQADLIRSLPEMIWHLDEPSDPIAACMYEAARLAARHVKVVLGGDGGDDCLPVLIATGNGYIRPTDWFLLPARANDRPVVGPDSGQSPTSTAPDPMGPRTL